MSLLAPLFLLGGVAILGPIIFHLIRRTTKDVVPFSSLMFLAPSPPRVTRRSRLEHLWLLLLRIAALLLLALGFARPLWQRITSAEVSGSAGQRTVVLLDTSASMQREDLWARAQARMQEIFARVREQESVAFIAFDRTERTLVSFEQWEKAAPGARDDLVRQALASLQPGWAGTHLGTALLHASELLNADPNASRFARQVIVVTDRQEGARLEGLQGYEWPRGTDVLFETIEPKQLGNARADWIAGADATSVRVRVTSDAGAKQEQFNLRWSAPNAAPIAAYVPAGQARTVTVPTPANGGDTLTLTGDDTPFDNETFIAPPRPEQTRILFLGLDEESDTQRSLYFLRRAFPSSEREKFDVIPHAPGAALAEWELTQARLLVLGEGVDDTGVATARRFAESGHVVLLPLTSAGSAKVLGALVEQSSLTSEEATVSNYAMLSQIDFQHELFASFADPRYSDFTKIHFWKYRRLAAESLPGARVLARFDSGDPAVLQVPLGRGSVFVFTSSWRPADSQLALSSKFLPLLHAMLAQSGGSSARREQYLVGDAVPFAAASTITAPGGEKTEVVAGASFTATTQPGLYGVQPGDDVFAVNLAPEESRANPLPLDRFLSLGVPLHRADTSTAPANTEASKHAQRTESESRQKLWRWLLLAAAAFVVGETLLAGLLSRPRMATA